MALFDGQSSLFDPETLFGLEDAGSATAGNASGSLPTVTVSTVAAATGKGKAATSGALPTVAVSAPAATSKGRGAATGALPTVTVTPPSASASSGAARAGGVGGKVAPWWMRAGFPSVVTQGVASGSLPTVAIGCISGFAVGHRAHAERPAELRAWLEGLASAERRPTL